MEIASSQSLSRLWRLALVGVATAFAWIVLSLLVGLGSGQAQADDGDDDGLLGAVTSVVDKAASTATDTVAKVAGGVEKTVKTVVAVAPEPVQQPVREAVKNVGSVVTKATEPVAEVVSGGAVTRVVEPVVDAVADVPVVGDVVAGIGLDDALTDVAGTVDDTLAGVAGAVDDTADLGLTPTAPVPALPPLPGASTPVEGHPLPALDVVLPAAPAVSAAWGAASALRPLVAYEPRSATAMPASAASIDLRGPLTPAGGLCPPSAVSSGPGGAGSGAWALVALGPLVALRAWVRRAGPEDDHAPPAPAGNTDVSPD